MSRKSFFSGSDYARKGWLFPGVPPDSAPLYLPASGVEREGESGLSELLPF